MTVAGEAAGGYAAIRAVAGDFPALPEDRAAPVQAAAALVHLALWSLKLAGASAQLGAIGGHLAHPLVLTVVKAFLELAAVSQEARRAAALRLVALVDGAGAVVGAVPGTHLLVACGAREARRAPTRGHSRGGGSTGPPVLAVLPALVQFTLVARVARLAAALGLASGIEEAAAPIEALEAAGARPGGVWWGGR